MKSEEICHRKASIQSQKKIGDADTYTVDQALDYIGFGRFQVKLSAITGLAIMADSVEMMILGVLSPLLQCEWGIDTTQQAMITTVVFCGAVCSSSLWGSFCDNFGRKVALISTTLFSLYFGFLSSFSPRYFWLLILRGLVGFGLGGDMQSLTLYSEFLPSSQRGICLTLTAIFWTFGALYVVAISIIILPVLNWRYLVGLASLPLVIFMLACAWLPESARYHFACGHPGKVIDTLERIANDNKSKLPSGKLVDTGEIEKRGRFKDLFSSSQLSLITVLAWLLWFCSFFGYYGIILLTTKMVAQKDACDVLFTEGESNGCRLSCTTLSTNDYLDILWTTLAEFPGVLVLVFIIDRLGRKLSTAFCFAIHATATALLAICSTKTAMMVLIFISRGFISASFQGLAVYVPEIYPTTVRAIALGTGGAFGRIGALLTPFVSEVLIGYSVYWPIGIYAGSGAIATIICLLLPVETKGRGMKETKGEVRRMSSVGEVRRMSSVASL